MMEKSVVLGFSGGIDSQTAARKLMADGYRVVLVTIDTIGDRAMLDKARRSAELLGCEWMVADKRKRFKEEIIDNFCNEYSLGHTPAPCTRCNTLIKWQSLEEVADSMNIYNIATGHYFNIEEHNGRYYVAKGADSTKDQSYYLWGLRQSTLQRAITPMGNIIKSDIKSHFKDKSESMGICFLRGCHYGEFLKSHGVEMCAGDIVDSRSKIIGRHCGIANYTIGQRRGAGIPEGLCVVDLDTTTNRITVGKREDLYKHTLYITECNMVDDNEVCTANNIMVKIRGIGINPTSYASVTRHKETYTITLEDPAWAPAKGQPVVLYRNNLVIGGGIVVDFK